MDAIEQKRGKGKHKAGIDILAILSSPLILTLIAIIIFTLLIAEEVEAQNATIAYRATNNCGAANGLFCPKIVDWNDIAQFGTLGAQVNLTTLGDQVQTMVLKQSPVKNKKILVVKTFNGTLHSYVCATGNCLSATDWYQTNQIAVVETPAQHNNSRNFDLEFESLTGDALLVWGPNAPSQSGTTCELRYKVLPYDEVDFNTTNSPDNCLDITRMDRNPQISWVEMSRNPNNRSQEIAMIATNLSAVEGGAYAFIWNGSAFANQLEISVAMTAAVAHSRKAVAVVYAADNSSAMFAAGTGATGNVNTTEWNLTGTSGPGYNARGTIDMSAAAAGSDVGFIVMKADPSTDDILMATEDANSGGGMSTAYWSGAAWTLTAAIDAAVDAVATRVVDVDWNNTNSNASLLWDTDTTGNRISLRFCQPQCSGVTGTVANHNQTTGAWLTLYRNPYAGNNLNNITIMGLKLGSSFDLGILLYNGSSNGTRSNWFNMSGTYVTKTANATNVEAYSLAWVSSNTSYIPDTNAPTWKFPVTNQTIIYKNQFVDFNMTWEDNRNLSGFFFSINQTGAFVNDSFVAFSGQSNISGASKQITADPGTVIEWRFGANDTRNPNFNWSDVMRFVVSTRPGYLNGTLLLPQGRTDVTQNTSFTLRANVTCISFDGQPATCGNVTGTALYNATNMTIFISYINTTSPGEIKFANSSNGGLSWSTTRITNRPSGATAFTLEGPTSLFAVDDKTIFLTYNNYSTAGPVSSFVIANSSNGGQSWDTSPFGGALILGLSGANASLHALDQKTVYLSFYNVSGRDLIFANSSNGGATVSTRMVADGDDVGLYNSIYAVDKNTIYISYFKETSSIPTGALMFANSSNGGLSWSNQTVDGTAGVGSFNSIAAPDKNTIYISYLIDTTGSTLDNLRVSNSSNGGRSWTVTTVDGNDTAGRYTSIKAFNRTSLFVSYQDYGALGGANTLKFARSVDGGASWALFTADVVLSTDVGYYSSIDAVDQNDMFIAYYDTTDGNLKIANSTNSGTNWNPRAIESDNNVGSFTSIKIVRDDTLPESYSNLSNGSTFYVIGNTTFSCAQELNTSTAQACQLNWTVNATGATDTTGSKYQFNVRFDSNYSITSKAEIYPPAVNPPSLPPAVAPNYTNISTVNITATFVATAISCIWGNESVNVKFGATDPGKNGINATMNSGNNESGDSVAPFRENGTFYNITNDPLATNAVNISIVGSGFLSGTNRIEIKNITWRSNSSTSGTDSNWSNDENNNTAIRMNETITTDGTDQTPDPEDLLLNLTVGTTGWYKFWINVPDSQIAGTYTGNYTTVCYSAS